MRTFIAIELPEEIKDSLARLQTKLKAANADVKWVEPANIHVTLKFLGEIDENTKVRVTDLLTEITRDRRAFDVTLAALGGFPRIESPRVVWAGLGEGDREVTELAGAIELGCAGIGISPEERNFSSHITLGRTRSSKNAKLLGETLTKLSASFSATGLRFTIGTITFFKSTLTPQGPVYEPLSKFPFSNPNI